MTDLPKGISFNKAAGKYKVAVFINGKNVPLGYYGYLSDAKRVLAIGKEAKEKYSRKHDIADRVKDAVNEWRVRFDFKPLRKRRK